MSIIAVTLNDLAPVVEVMGDLADAGGGWINLVPEGTERSELSSTRSVPGMIFGRVGGRGPATPKITWIAPEVRRKRTAPAQIGIEHPAGPKAAHQLADAGHPIPSEWAVLQDHAIRGLVVAVAPVEPHADHQGDIGWAIGAAGILIGATVEAWQAQVFRG